MPTQKFIFTSKSIVHLDISSNKPKQSLLFAMHPSACVHTLDLNNKLSNNYCCRCFKSRAYSVYCNFHSHFSLILKPFILQLIVVRWPSVCKIICLSTICSVELKVTWPHCWSIESICMYVYGERRLKRRVDCRVQSHGIKTLHNGLFSGNRSIR